jgi:hypothetical protein
MNTQAGSWIATHARGIDLSIAGLIAAGTMALLWATLSDYGMAWDEG